MAIINVLNTDTFDGWRTKTNSLAVSLGDTSTLTTTATDVSGAASEINGNIGTMNSLKIASPDLVSSINDILRRNFALSLALG